jgi:hypothetical protein
MLRLDSEFSLNLESQSQPRSMQLECDETCVMCAQAAQHQDNEGPVDCGLSVQHTTN